CYCEPSDWGAYATVQEAVDAVGGQSEFNRANIFIAPGMYREAVSVAKPYVSFIGTGDSPAATKITFPGVLGSGPSFWGPALEIQSAATAFMARDITFENSVPDKNLTAAVATRSAADRAIFDNVRFLGYQDTLMVDEIS